MNTFARSLLAVVVAIVALGIGSLTPVEVGAAPASIVLAVPLVSDATPAGQPAYDPYALLSVYDYTTHNCPPENCGTGDQCGFLPPGASCGTLPNCTCKKCHEWGICRQN